MTCGLCNARKARRACPALGRGICPTCCGTSRLVEIACPSTCGWLHCAQAHPPAALQRQQAADQRLLRPLLDGLDQGAYLALTVCLEEALAFRASAVPAPSDDDLRQAAAALAATGETAVRGVIYDHQPDSLVARRLASALRDALNRLRESDAAPRDDETIAALRRIERVVQAARRESAPAPATFFDFLARVLRPRDAAAASRMAEGALASLVGEDEGGTPPSRLILP